MRKNNKYTDFVGRNIQYDTDGVSVVDGVFECNHCGKANIRYDDLNEHFEKCFKKEEIEWQAEHRPGFDIKDWELVFVREQVGMDVCMLPQYKIKEEEEPEEQSKYKKHYIDTNALPSDVADKVYKFMSENELETHNNIHVVKNRNKNEERYVIWYDEPIENDST